MPERCVLIVLIRLVHIYLTIWWRGTVPSDGGRGNGGVISMDQSKVLSIAREYADTVRQIMDTDAILFYGSHARGTATADSDIDIAIVVDHIPADYLGSVTALWKLTRTVNLEIEPVLLATSDDRSGFLSTVRRTGIAV